MDPEFWLKRWQDAETGFHRDTPQTLLVSHWHRMQLPKNSRVFVPLCGRSADMVWLAGQGLTVVGSELSPIAVDQFFRENNQSPVSDAHGNLINKTAGPFEIWQGDLFDLDAQDIRPIDAIYDRAALVALPPNAQACYAEFLTCVTPTYGKIFLISLDYNSDEMKGPPFSTPPDRVSALFGAAFDINLIATNPDAIADSENLKTRGLTALTETLYILTKRG